MADERTVSTTDVVSYFDNGDPNYIFEIVDKTARANITSINTTLGKKRSIFYCDYFKFNSADTTKTKQRYQFVGPYHKMTNGAKTFTAANLIAGDVCFSTEIRAYDGTTVLRRGIFALEYNYKSSSKYYSPAAYTYGAVDFDFTDRLPQTTSADAGKVLTVDSSGAWGAANPATELPAVTSSDENSVLAVDSSGTWVANSDFNSRLDTVESNVSNALNDIEALQYDVDAVESSVENLESTVNTDISNLQDDISALDESVTTLNGLTFYMQNATSSDYGKVLVWTEHDEWEVADVPTELPAVTSSDNGKVLKVASGAWTKAAETKELPSVTTSDNNKVLKVVSGAWAKAAAPTELPAVTSADNGRVLLVDNGAWSKMDMPTELPTVDNDDNGKYLQVVSGDWIKAYPDILPQVTSSDYESVLAVNSSGDWEVNSDFNTRLNDVESVAGTAANDVLDLQDRVGFTESDISTLQSDMSSAQGDITTLQDESESHGSSITELDNLTTYMNNVGSSDYGKVLTWTNNAVWEAADVPKELPSVTTSDNNKVLKVVSGAWAKAAETKELPAVTTSDNGKILKVVSGAWAKAAETKELPTVTTSDAGNVLTVNSSGKWAKAAPPTELPAVTSADNGRVLLVDNGAWSKMDMPTELPTVDNDDNGKYLQVVSGDWIKAYPDILPQMTSSDEGKVLTVNSSGEWEAATPSSGGSDETLYAHIAPSPPVVFSKTNAGILEDFIAAIKNNWANFDWTNRHRAIIVGSNSMGGKHYGNAINVCWQFNSSTKPNELNVLEFDFMSEGTILHFKYNNSTYTVKEIVGTTTGVTYTDISSETGYNIKMTEFWLYQ